MLRVVEPLRKTRRDLRHLCAQHGDQPAAEQRKQDLLEVVLRGRHRIGRLQSRVLSQNRAVQLLELAARLDAELFDQERSAVLIRLQRLRLSARSIERQHVLTPKPLAHRMLLDQSFELPDELAVARGIQIGLHTLLERGEPKLLEMRDVRLSERLEGKVGEWWTSPEREGLAELFRTFARLGETDLLHARAEAVEVELAIPNVKPVSRRLRLQNLGPERLP